MKHFLYHLVNHSKFGNEYHIHTNLLINPCIIYAFINDFVYLQQYVLSLSTDLFPHSFVHSLIYLLTFILSSICLCSTKTFVLVRFVINTLIYCFIHLFLCLCNLTFTIHSGCTMYLHLLCSHNPSLINVCVYALVHSLICLFDSPFICLFNSTKQECIFIHIIYPSALLSKSLTYSHLFACLLIFPIYSNTQNQFISVFVFHLSAGGHDSNSGWSFRPLRSDHGLRGDFISCPDDDRSARGCYTGLFSGPPPQRGKHLSFISMRKSVFALVCCWHPDCST